MESSAQNPSAPDPLTQWRRFCREALPGLKVPAHRPGMAGLSGWITASFDPSIDARGLGEGLARNPAHVAWINALLRQKGAEDLLGGDAEGLRPDRMVTYLGREGVRQLRVAFWLARLRAGAGSEAGLPRRGSDTLKVEPPKLAAFAARASVWRADHDVPYAEETFRAGLLWDQAAALFPQVQAAIWEEHFKAGMQAGAIIVRLGKQLKHFEYGRFALAAPLLSALGKSLATVLPPLQPTELAATTARANRFFKIMERSLRFCGEPWVIPRIREADRDLAYLLWLSQTPRSERDLGPVGLKWLESRQISLRELKAAHNSK